jgi:cell division protein FtsL
MSAQHQQTEYSLAMEHPLQTSPQRKYRSCARRRVPLQDSIVSLACIAIPFAVVWLLTGQDVKIHRMTYAIDQLQGQVQQTGISNADLSAEVDELTQPARILNIAVGELHMQFASPLQISDLSRSK